MEIKTSKTILLEIIVGLLIAFSSVIGFVGNNFYNSIVNSEEEVFQLKEELSIMRQELHDMKSILYKSMNYKTL